LGVRVLRPLSEPELLRNPTLHGQRWHAHLLRVRLETRPRLLLWRKLLDANADRITGDAAATGFATRDAWYSEQTSLVTYSITSSARARIEGGMVRPSALAVFKLTTNSKVVGCCTGRSAGLAPFRIFPA